jgi:hypothetical protein
MPDINQLAEQHILEHESRLKHIDELIEKVDEASQALADSSAVSAELANLKKERALLVDQLDEIRQKSIEEWAKSGGPMVMWDIVANRLENLIERVKH